MTDLSAECQNDPPRVGDAIVVSYSLTNDGTNDRHLEGTFLGVRDAADQNLDSEYSNTGVDLQPGESVEVRQPVPLESAGTWRVWPCYELQGGEICPDEWLAFNVVAG